MTVLVHGTQVRHRAPIEERFLRYVLKTDDGCWIWTASKRRGYGRFTVERRYGQAYQVAAHRWAYERWVGPLGSLHAHHECRNRACVRPGPGHVVPITASEHARLEGPAAANLLKTHCPQGHPYTPENTYRKGNRKGGVRRTCRTCDLAAQARYRARMRNRG